MHTSTNSTCLLSQRLTKNKGVRTSEMMHGPVSIGTGPCIFAALQWSALTSIKLLQIAWCTLTISVFTKVQYSIAILSCVAMHKTYMYIAEYVCTHVCIYAAMFRYMHIYLQLCPKFRHQQQQISFLSTGEHKLMTSYGKTLVHLFCTSPLFNNN